MKNSPPSIYLSRTHHAHTQYYHKFIYGQIKSAHSFHLGSVELLQKIIIIIYFNNILAASKQNKICRKESCVHFFVAFCLWGISAKCANKFRRTNKMDWNKYSGHEIVNLPISKLFPAKPKRMQQNEKRKDQKSEHSFGKQFHVGVINIFINNRVFYFIFFFRSFFSFSAVWFSSLNQTDCIKREIWQYVRVLINILYFPSQFSFSLRLVIVIIIIACALSLKEHSAQTNMNTAHARTHNSSSTFSVISRRKMHLKWIIVVCFDFYRKH